jgi:hypothetical protein
MVIHAPLRNFSRINEFTSLGMAGRAVSHLRLDMLIGGFTFVLCNLVLTTVPMDVARKSGFFSNTVPCDNNHNRMRRYQSWVLVSYRKSWLRSPSQLSNTNTDYG